MNDAHCELRYSLPIKLMPLTDKKSRSIAQPSVPNPPDPANDHIKLIARAINWVSIKINVCPHNLLLTAKDGYNRESELHNLQHLNSVFELNYN